jgi:pimeloyl-ACP methyl ester carboxylesterase
MNDDALYEQDRASRAETWDEAAFHRTFRHDISISDNRVRIHYVAGGNGPAIVLLHGFPQHWREWRLIMPALAESGYRVIAPDLRGFGFSDKPLDSFDIVTVSEDIRQLVAQDGTREVSLVGHDVGAAVAYAWAAGHPDEVQRLTLIEGLPAGLEPKPAGAPMLRGKPLWHLAFGSTPDVPEILLANRERTFIEFLLRQGAYDQTTFPDEEIEAYTCTFAAVSGVRGALAHIRAIPQSAALNRKLSERRLTMPVLAIGAALSFGEHMEEGARQFANSVMGAVAERCGHWIPEERPVWLTRQLAGFFGRDRQQPELASASHGGSYRPES